MEKTIEQLRYDVNSSALLISSLMAEIISNAPTEQGAGDGSSSSTNATTSGSSSATGAGSGNIALTRKRERLTEVIDRLETIKRRSLNIIRDNIKDVNEYHKKYVKDNDDISLEMSTVPPATFHTFICERNWITKYKEATAMNIKLFVDECYKNKKREHGNRVGFTFSHFLSDDVKEYATAEHALEYIMEHYDPLISKLIYSESVDSYDRTVIQCEYETIIKFVIIFSPHLNKRKCLSITAYAPNEDTQSDRAPQSKSEAFRKITNRISQEYPFKDAVGKDKEILSYLAICSLPKYQHFLKNRGLSRINHVSLS